MANTGALGSPDQRASNPSYANSALSNAVAQAPQYWQQLYNNQQAGQGTPGYNWQVGPGGQVQGVGPGGQSVPGAAGTALASGQWQNNIFGGILGSVAPQIAQYGVSGATALGQMATVVPQTQLSAAELQSNTNYDVANALLNYQGLGLQSQGLATQAGTAAAQQGIEQSQYGVQMGQYPEQLAQAALQNYNAVKGMQDQAAISNTGGLPGYQRQMATQAAQYGWQQADIYRNAQLAQLQQESEQVGYGGQQAGIANQMQQLGIQAKQQGLSTQQAYNQLNFGVQQLGFQGLDQLLQYANQAGSAQGGAAAAIAGVLSNASLLGGGSATAGASIAGSS